MLQVPYFKQTSPLNCGAVALQMVLSFFGDNRDLDFLEELTGTKRGKAIATLEIGTAAAKCGYKVNFYSICLGFNPHNVELEFYQTDTAMSPSYAETIGKEARKNGVSTEERNLSLEEILKNLSERSIPIVLLDWAIVKGKREKGYVGHFVPIVGYDEENIYVHSPSLREPEAFYPIERSLFEEARKAQGTDEDIVIIYKK